MGWNSVIFSKGPNRALKDGTEATERQHDRERRPIASEPDADQSKRNEPGVC
jgi:hypothetical protein